MKKLLLTSIAVLFLATGTAHAIEYDCGSHDTVRVIQEWPATRDSTTVIRIESTDKNKHVRYRNVQYDIEKEILTFNGKQCKKAK